ncbi:MAG: UDP-N-acetylmuramate dehydrogenase [Spirochaetota bacterium]
MSYFDNKLKLELNKLGILKINEPLKNYTSFKTGGPADFIIWPNDQNSLKEIILLSREESVTVTLLGGCTNLLVGDKGIRGVVIMQNSASGKIKGKISVQDDGLVYSDAINLKEKFLNYCVDFGYEGMEFMAGIPGCIGGGIVMNAGTIDGNFADILTSISIMNTEGVVTNCSLAKNAAGYRTMGIPKEYIVLGGYFKMQRTPDKEKVKAKIDRLLQERKSKHPLNYPSAGSVFKNPAGYSSWKLVDESGLKGKGIGGARVSELHTNFIINSGNATSLDILTLINLIKETVYNRFKIILEPEIKMVGEF